MTHLEVILQGADEASYLNRASSQQSRCGDNYAASLLSVQTIPGNSEVPKVLLELLKCCSALTKCCKVFSLAALSNSEAASCLSRETARLQPSHVQCPSA